MPMYQDPEEGHVDKESGYPADRRAQAQNPPSRREVQANAAPQGKAPIDMIYKDCQPEPNRFLVAPYPEVHVDEGANDEIIDVNVYLFGDAFDPKSPSRVRSVDWKVDTDQDGVEN